MGLLQEEVVVEAEAEAEVVVEFLLVEVVE